MSGHTNNVHIIKDKGIPLFAVIPYEDYLKLLPEEEINDTVPQEVAERAILEDMPLLKAWRLHLGLTQKKVAQRAGISQSALSQMERTENPNRTATLEKLAKAMDLSPEQLRD